MSGPPGLAIRRAGPGDAALLAALAERTFRDAFGDANRREDLELHVRTHYTAARIGEELAEPGAVTLLAEVHRVAVGYAQLRSFEPPFPLGAGGLMLHRFYLEQTWIGKGIATSLMDVVRGEARARGANFLWLTVWEANPRAIAFYRKCGFSQVGTTTFTVGTDPQQDWVMRSPV